MGAVRGLSLGIGIFPRKYPHFHAFSRKFRISKDLTCQGNFLVYTLPDKYAQITSIIVLSKMSIIKWPIYISNIIIIYHYIINNFIPLLKTPVIMAQDSCQPFKWHCVMIFQFQNVLGRCCHLPIHQP